jgi:hypothetical protein
MEVSRTTADGRRERSRHVAELREEVTQ